MALSVYDSMQTVADCRATGDEGKGQRLTKIDVDWMSARDCVAVIPSAMPEEDLNTCQKTA